MPCVDLVDLVDLADLPAPLRRVGMPVASMEHPVVTGAAPTHHDGPHAPRGLRTPGCAEASGCVANRYSGPGGIGGMPGRPADPAALASAAASRPAPRRIRDVVPSPFAGGGITTTGQDDR